VASGRATFTIDGTGYDAPAGTYVLIPDPASHRHAVAKEAGTTVLSFGGPPTFRPSAWEWTFRANPLVRSEPARAREILKEGLEVHPESGWLYYALASLEAVHGNREAALDAFR
jgi:AraC-like ligand binding domain